MEKPSEYLLRHVPDLVHRQGRAGKAKALSAQHGWWERGGQHVGQPMGGDQRTPWSTES